MLSSSKFQATENGEALGSNLAVDVGNAKKNMFKYTFTFTNTIHIEDMAWLC